MKHFKNSCFSAFMLALNTLVAQCPTPVTLANLSFSPNKAVYCPGDNVVVTLTTPNTILSLVWSYNGGAGSRVNSPTNVYTISNLFSSGQVIVNGMTKANPGGQNCPVNLTKLIQVNPAITANAGPDAFIGSNVSQVNIGGFGSSPSASGGTAPYTYAWLPVTNLNSATAANPIANPPANANYVLTVTDNVGCTKTDNVTVYNVSTITNNKYYAVLGKKLDAGYYNSINKSGTNIFYFKFDEEYHVPAATNLTYKIFDDNGTLLSTTPALVETIGDNRFALNVASLTVGSFYRVYLYNKKNEVWRGRLKIN
jgi:hypothetical protein